MSTPGLAPPPSRETPRAQAGAAPAAPLRRPVLRLRPAAPRDGGRGWFVLGSVGLHLLLLAVAVLFLKLGPRLGTVQRAAPEPPEEQVVYYDLPTAPLPGPAGVPQAATAPEAGAAPVPAGETARTPRRAEAPLIQNWPSAAAGGVAVPSPAPGPTSPVGAGAGGAGGGVSDRLRPGFSDPRLYVDPKVEALKRADTRSDHEKYMERFQARIEALNDSMLVASKAAKTTSDWSFKDKNGKTWGLSEKGLHLGGMTIPRALIPLPSATGDNASLEKSRQAARDREAIRQQEEDREAREARDEHNRRVREEGKSGAQKPQGGA